jgi:Integrase zinc binding domain
VHRPGRAHSNVDPLSRLPRIPMFISPAREDLPDTSLSTKHEELQRVWLTFIKERELAVETKVITKRTKKSLKTTSPKDVEVTEGVLKLHVHADEDTIKRFIKEYKTDKDFASLFNRTSNEGADDKKYQAYRFSDNGLLYFEDADHKIRLCVPLKERAALIKEVHNEAHESAHAGWERTLASLRQRFYWPTMRLDTTEYV